MAELLTAEIVSEFQHRVHKPGWSESVYDRSGCRRSGIC